MEEGKGIGKSSLRSDQDNSYPSKRACLNADSRFGQKDDPKLVYPWTGILANVPRTYVEKKRKYEGGSGRKLKEDLAIKRFNPIKVKSVWNSWIGHTGYALVEFGKEWEGFANGINFEKHFQVNKCGKREYDAAACKGGDKLYGWLAKEEDYHSESTFGSHLRKDRILTSVSEKMAEDERKELRSVPDLKNTLEIRKSGLQQMESKCKAAEDMLKLAEKQKRETEELLWKKVYKFQQKRNAEQALELEIEKMRGELRVMRHMVQGSEDTDIKNRLENTKEKLKEKEEEWEQQESFREDLVVDDELEDARKAMIETLKELSVDGVIGVKMIGKLDEEVFRKVAKEKYPAEEADEKAVELLNLWKRNLRDSAWRPRKVIMIDGKPEEVLNEEDEKLQELKRELGDEVFKAVKNAFEELNEYDNGSGRRHTVPQLWNFEEGRKVTLEEGVEYLISLWKN